MQITTVYHPEHFIIMASVANTLKGISMMSGGSTRAAFNISFAQGENIADITAKATSQYICSSLLGTCFGILISSQLSGNAGSALAVSCSIALFAAFLTYSTIRSVPLASLNSTRLQLLISRYKSLSAGYVSPKVQELPRPSQICAADPVIVLPFWAPQESTFYPAIEVNTLLSKLLHPSLDSAALKLRGLVSIHSDTPHMIMRDGRQRSSKIHLLLHKSATPEDAIAAMLHAALFRCVLHALLLPCR
jgi:hypothetical protein